MISFTPPSRTDRLYSGFFQDEIQVGADVWLTVGSKLEHNSYTGFEVEPNVRIAWAPSNRHTLWAAFGRSIRQPARVETSIAATLASIPLDANTTEILRLIGNPELDAETAIDFEAGWRTQFSSSASLDVATYLTKYRKLTTIEPGTPGLLPGVPSIIEVPLLYENLSSALDYGGEVALTWNATPRWRIVPNYSFLHMNVRVDPQSQDTTSIWGGDLRSHPHGRRALAGEPHAESGIRPMALMDGPAAGNRCGRVRETGCAHRAKIRRIR